MIIFVSLFSFYIVHDNLKSACHVGPTVCFILLMHKSFIFSMLYIVVIQF